MAAGEEGDDYASRALQRVNYNQISPRVGFAYSLPGEQTVVRGGWGVFYSNMITVGGIAARWDEEQQRLIVAVSRWGYLEPGRPVPEGRLMEAFRSGEAMHVKEHEWVLPGGAPGSVYIVPIPCDIGPKGLLFVLLPKSALFVSDDLSLLRVCCRETAVQLDNVTLRARQQALIHDLAEQSKQLAAVNKELESFSYSVSHDLRAPLRHIGGFAQLLDKSAGSRLDDTGRRYLRVISESAVKMGELVDSLLVFSRMGRTEMLHTRVDLNTLVRTAQRDVAQAESSRSIDWIIQPLPNVPGDQNMLQILHPLDSTVGALPSALHGGVLIYMIIFSRFRTFPAIRTCCSWSSRTFCRTPQSIPVRGKTRESKSAPSMERPAKQ